MTRQELEDRTKRFHINCIKLCNVMPKTAAGFEIGKQLIRSSGSVGANYRASGRSKSKKDFVYKIEVTLEEADESHYWLEIIKKTELLYSKELEDLTGESEELTKIFYTSVKTAKANGTAQKDNQESSNKRNRRSNTGSQQIEKSKNPKIKGSQDPQIDKSGNS